MTEKSLPPPGPAMEERLFTSLAQLVREDIVKACAGSVYRELSARQFAMKAAHHARDWNLDLRGEDEPLPGWMLTWESHD